jgi:pilus assembly protein CpaB
MNSRAFTLSLIIALIAVFMVNSYIESQEASFTEKYGDQKQVIVAKEDIKELETIDDRKLEIKTVPNNYLMPGAFTTVEALYNTIAAVPIKKGEQITQPRIIYPGAKSGLSRQISQGKRAFTIGTSRHTAVANLIKPGDRVDIIANIDYSGGRLEKMKVKTVLQDVYILATGKRVTREIPLAKFKVDKEIRKLDLSTYTNFSTVTLELTPTEVQKLAFVVQNGKGYYLSLRNNDDKAVERVGATKLYNVLGEDAAEAKQYFLEKQQREERKR